MAQLRHGADLAGYRIEAPIGEGSTGVVYSALDVALDRRVALKVLLPELAHDARFRERFLRESKVAASLEHPNIVPIHAVGEADGMLFIAMRYVEGRDLSAVLRQLGRLEPERAVALLSQVASALEAAHERGLVHRDVKPGNILVARHGEREHAYLCDFGLAKHASTVTSLTGERSVVGTVDYLAPEQIEGLPVDGRVDVYGLGCVLFECLTGTPPYGRENELASLLAHLKEPIPQVSERRPELPEALDDVVAAALAKDRDERYPTCGAMIAAVEAALAGETPERPVASEKPPAILQTFVFCDIRGYTAYTREHGDEAAAALASRFAELVGALAPEFDGRLLQLRGDEALIVFASARNALRFALALQQRVTDDKLPRGVGVGLDAGEAVPVEDGFRGDALNRAARLCALAGPGDVLASDGVVHLAGKVDGVAYGRRRSERLKGFDEPVTLVEIKPAAEGVSIRERRTPRWSRRAPLVALGVLLAAAGAVAAVLALTGGGDGVAGSTTGNQATTGTSVASPQAPANALVSFDPATGKPGASVAGQTAWAFIRGEGVLYGLDPNQQYLVELDPASATVESRIPVDRPHRFLPTVEFGSIWYTTENGNELVRADPVFHRTVATIKLPEMGLERSFGLPPGGVVRVGDEIWVTYGYPARAARIDPAQNEVVETWRLPDGPPVSTDIVAGGGDVWALYDDGSSVIRLSPAGDVEATGKLAGGRVVDAVAAEGYLWVAMDSIGGVWKVDGHAAVQKQIATGATPWQMVEAGGYLWVSNARAGSVSRLDTRTDAVRQTKTGHRPLGVAVADDRLWVGLEPSAAEARAHIEGMRVLTTALAEDSLVTDPAAIGDHASFAFAFAIEVSLMRYRPTTDGTAAVVPELAEGQPQVSDGLRRYTFAIRPGFRFSPPSGKPVTAEAVRYSLERAIAEDYCGYLLADIVGADALRAGKAEHVAGIRVVGNTISIELTGPSATLPARLASPCTSVVPVGTPVVEGGLPQPIASAGPYYLDSHTAGEQLVLVPNPNYSGARPAQLDGIVFTVAGDPERAAGLVEQHRADLALDIGRPPSPAFAFDGRLASEYGQEECPRSADGQPCFVRPKASAVRYLQLNTLHGSLTDRSVRQALSLALDRSGVARVGQGYATTRMIGPGIPGYAPEPLVPPTGDLAEARKLMDGRTATVILGIARFDDEARSVADAIRGQLERTGIRVVVKALDDPFAEAVRPTTTLTVLFDGWNPDYPDAEDVIYPVVSPRSPDFFFPPWFTKDAVLDRIDAARNIVGPGRPAAWRAIDEGLAQEAAFIPLYTTFSFPQLFSARVGCQNFLPLYGGLVDLGSLCLR